MWSLGICFEFVAAHLQGDVLCDAPMQPSTGKKVSLVSFLGCVYSEKLKCTCRSTYIMYVNLQARFLLRKEKKREQLMS